MNTCIDVPPNITRVWQQWQGGDFNLSDGSGALFSMYLDKAVVEDREMVESWKGDADKILFFVSLQTISHTSAYNLEIVDWCVLCYGCGTARSVRPKCRAEPTGCLSFLPCAYLSGTFYPAKWVPTSHPVEPVQPHRAIRPTYFGRLGQRTLVFESGH